MSRRSRSGAWQATSALAAVAAAQPFAAAAQPTDEIVVTLTRAPTRAQDLPIAIAAYDAGTLARAGVDDIRELSILSPSLLVVATGSEGVSVNARIRGVGTVGDNPGLQSSVSVYIDEVFRSRNSPALGELLDVEAIEVARGAQGVLYGRNASAGAIIARSRAPSFEAAGRIEATRANFDGTRLEAGLTGPITERLAGRIAAFAERRDGFLLDVVSGERINDRNRWGMRGQLLFEPREGLSFRLIGDVAERDEVCCGAVELIRGPRGPLIDGLSDGALSLLSADPFDRETAVTPGRSYTQDVRDAGVSLKAAWSPGAFTVSSVSAYRSFRLNRSQDGDLGPADILFRPEEGFINTFETVSEEINVSGEAGPLNWLAGVFFLDEDVGLTDRQSLGADYEFVAGDIIERVSGAPFTYADLTGLPGGAVFDGAGQFDRHRTNARSVAVYSSNRLALGPRLTLTLGARFTHERIRYDADLVSQNAGCDAALDALGADGTLNALGAALADAGADRLAASLACLVNITPLGDGTVDGRRTENEVTWDAKASYALTPDLTAFAGAARGYKSGGFNLDRAGGPSAAFGALDGERTLSVGDDLEFDEETVVNIEAGFKARLFDGRARLDAVGFYSDFSDYQLNTFNGVSFVVENIAEVISSGFEIDLAADLGERFTVTGAVARANTRYGDDIVSAVRSSDGRPLNGRAITLAPRWSATAGLAFRQPVGARREIYASWNARYASTFNTGSDLDPEKQQDAFVVLNAAAGLAQTSSGVEFEAFVRNLTDAEIIQVAFDAPLQAGSFGAFLAEPRTYGVTARVRF